MALFSTYLTELELHDIDAALRTHFRVSKWFPTPQEIIDLVQGSTEERALSEWGAIRASLGRDLPSISTAAGKALQLIGGRTAIGQARVEDVRWLQKDFLRHYGEQLKQETYNGYLTETKRKQLRGAS